MPNQPRSRTLAPQTLKALTRNPAAGAFLIPVDWKALKLPTYPKIVKHPMDLGTIQQKLESSRYGKVQDFIADVKLVWSNAKAFNLEGSDIYEVAMLLEEEFDSKLEVHDGPLREGGGSKGQGGSGASSGGSLAGEQLAACKTAMRELRKHKDAGAFLEPVDWKVRACMRRRCLQRARRERGRGCSRGMRDSSPRAAASAAQDGRCCSAAAACSVAHAHG